MRAWRLGRLDEVDAQVLMLGDAQLGVDHQLERVALEAADHHDRAGQREADDAEQRLPRPALDITQHHARRLAEQAPQPEALEQAGRKRSGAGGRIASAGGSRAERAGRCSAPIAAAANATVTPVVRASALDAVVEEREAVEVAVDSGEQIGRARRRRQRR